MILNMQIIPQILKNKFGIGLVLFIVLGAGYFQNKIFRDEIPVQYVTASAERGTLILSVTGTGQTNVSDQMDIKPEVSGKVTAVYVKKGQEVKKWALLASIDSRDAQRAVRDAEISLESAQVELGELLAGSDDQSLLQAENALLQAKRDLEKAKEDYESIEVDAATSLASAYEDGYSDVSTLFFKLSDYMKDLQDVLGTEQITEKNIDLYKLILGKSSPFIQKLLDDYYKANDLYNKNFTFFRKVFRDDDHNTVYLLISDTLETTKAISQAMESARHMYDAIVLGGYKQYYISSSVDKMQPKIESDLSSIFSNINSLQKTIDTIDDTVGDTPGKIKDSELVFELAKEKVEDKRLVLDELRAGADSLGIRSQQNIVAQKEAILLDAKEKLADHFVRAPFDGVIAEIDTRAGDSVSSGTTIAILTTRQQIAELTLNEIDIAKVKLNQLATLTFDAVDELTLTGKVTDIASFASTNQGVVTYGITIMLDTVSDLIKPGMTVDASIIVERKDSVVLVPNSAVQSQGGQIFVEVMQNGTPQVVPVEVGLSNELFTEITGGLQAEVEIVTARIGGEGSSQAANIGQSFRAPGFGGGGFRGGGGGFISH